MQPFLEFWWDCLVSSAETGHSVFGIAEVVLALLWLFWGRVKSEEEQMQAENYIKKLVKIAFLCLFIGSFAVWQPYAKWKEADKKKTEAEGMLSAFENAKPTPIRDDAMRLVAALDEFLLDAEVKKLPQDQVTERFGKADFDQRVVRVHHELRERNHHIERFYEIARKLETVGVYNAFMNVYNKTPVLAITEIRDDLKTLAQPINE